MSEHYGVFRDANRHTCVRVDSSRKGVAIIRMAAGALSVERISHLEFEREFEPIPDYTPQRAAQRYLQQGQGINPEISPEARAHLERMAGPLYDRSKDRVDDVTVDIPSSSAPNTPKDPTMSETTTAPAKRKKAPPPAAKKASKAAAAPAKKAKVAAAEPSGRGRAPNIAGTAKIKILVKENPKRAAAAERFDLYKNGMTVDEYIAAGGKRADVNWDVAQKFIEVK
jgi:hypothetical protein